MAPSFLAAVAFGLSKLPGRLVLGRMNDKDGPVGGWNGAGLLVNSFLPFAGA